MKKTFPHSFVLAAIIVSGLFSSCKSYVCTTYTNPLTKVNCADPTVLDDRERTGYFYAYSTVAKVETGEKYNLPVYRSKDLVNWELVSDGFSAGRPMGVENSACWAPDINYVNGQYVLYYSLGVWYDVIQSSSGVAVSDSPTGPFIDKGILVNRYTANSSNNIDANLLIDGDKQYLFWGSHGSVSGVYAIELNKDCTSIKEGAQPVKIGTNIEGTYIVKRGKYYYFFGSKDHCCLKENSTYHIVLARSENPLGPYVGPDGTSTLSPDFNYTIMHRSDDRLYTGTGHNSQIITDDAGQDWMLYHTYFAEDGYNARFLAMDQIVWDEDGWPHFKNGAEPSRGVTEGPKWFK